MADNNLIYCFTFAKNLPLIYEDSSVLDQLPDNKFYRTPKRASYEARSNAINTIIIPAIKKSGITKAITYNNYMRHKNEIDQFINDIVDDNIVILEINGNDVSVYRTIDREVIIHEAINRLNSQRSYSNSNAPPPPQPRVGEMAPLEEKRAWIKWAFERINQRVNEKRKSTRE